MHDCASPQRLSWHLGLLGALSAASLAALVLRPDHVPAHPASESRASTVEPAAAVATPTPPSSDGEPMDPSDKPDKPDKPDIPESSEATEDALAAEVPCINDSTELTTDGKDAILCWGEHCRAFDRAHGDAGAVPAPSPPDPPEESPSITGEHGALEICTAEHCTRIGPRLAAALTAAHAAAVDATAAPPRWQATESTPDPDEDAMPSALLGASATRDHRIVTFHGPFAPALDEKIPVQAWDVARDRLLALHPSPSHATGGLLVALEPIGDLLVATWTDERLENRRAIVVDRDGRNRGAEFEAGELVQQTRDRFVVLGELGALTVIDHGRATSAGVPTGPATGVRIDDHRIFASAWEQDHYRLFLIEDGQARTIEMLPACRP